MAEHDGAPAVEGVQTAPDVHEVEAPVQIVEEFGPPPGIETKPLLIEPDSDIETLPDYYTQPDIETQPDYHIVPDDQSQIPRPDNQPDGCFPMPPVASRDELELALHRAQLVAEDCASVLDPAIRAMEEGAWVSSRADEFFTGLTTHSRLAGSIGQSCVDTIIEALETGRPDDLLELKPL